MHSQSPLLSARQISTTQSHSSQHKRPPIVDGMLTNTTSYLIPEPIRNQFKANGGWASHIPLTYLTDKACSTSQKPFDQPCETLSFDTHSGQILTSTKQLSTAGELDLTFDEWHQAWRRLLTLIGDYCPNIHHAWDHHFCRIRDTDSRAEHWPLWLAYDTKLHHRAIHKGYDPKLEHIGLWNELEVRYNTNHIRAGLQGFNSTHRNNNDQYFENNHRRSSHTSSSNRFHPYNHDRPNQSYS